VRTLGIVPARAGSVRLPGKNLAVLGGKTLVERALDAATGASRLIAVALSSDDPRALALGERRAGVIVIERPPELAGERSPAIDYVRHALAAIAARGGEAFDAVAIVQPSSPLTLAGDVDGTVELLAATGADSAVTAVRLDHAIHPLKLKRLDGDRLVPLFADEGGRMATHELEPVYIRNGAVYATRRRVIDRGQILGDDCRAYVMPRERSIDINDRLDLEFAAFLLDRVERADSAPLLSPSSGFSPPPTSPPGRAPSKG